MKAIDNNYKKVLQFFIGMFLLILGVKFVLLWWDDVLVLLRGVMGIIFALVGLVVLYIIKK